MVALRGLPDRPMTMAGLISEPDSPMSTQSSHIGGSGDDSPCSGIYEPDTPCSDLGAIINGAIYIVMKH